MLTSLTVPALPGAGAITEELAVIQTIASILNSDSAHRYDYLYFATDFPARPYVTSSMANPDRTQFCGLTREQGQSLVNELTQLTSKPLEFDSAVAEPAGLRIGHKRLPRFRYLTVSRVVFDPANEHAWLAVDLNGESGAILRLDKIDGQWSKTQRCGGWMKTEE